MAIGGDDRVVRVDADTLVRLKTLQGELTASTGLKFRLGDVVRRATQALAAAHNAGAWLSPAESAPLFERRHREAIISAAAQLAARLRPDLRLEGVEFDAARASLVLMFGEEHPAVGVHVAGLLGPSSADREIVA